MRRLSTQGLARAASVHPWRTIGAWLVVLVASVAAIVLFLPSGLTTDNRVTASTESKRAYALLAERLPQPSDESELVVVRSRTLTADDPAFRARVQRLFQEGAALGRHVIAGGTSPYGPGGRGLFSPDRHAVLVPFVLAEDDAVGEVLPLVRRLDAEPRFDAALYGGAIVDRDFQDVSQHDLKTGESFGIAAALVVLALVFGAFVAAVIPILLALISIAVALGLAALLGQAVELSIFVTNMIAGMGLALGIDYALFVLSRYREERSAGRDRHDAIAAAGATASRAVLFSGLAVVLALCGMLLVPDTILRSLGAGAILVGIVSVAAALTLLPALLGLLGDRVNSLRVPLIGRGAASGHAEGRFWAWVARNVMRRPAVSLALAAALMLAAAAPLLGIKTGAAGVSTLPDHVPAKQGFRLLNETFSIGRESPTLIVVDGHVRSPEVAGAIGRLRRSFAGDPDLGRSRLTTNRAGDLALVSVPVAGDPTGERAVAAVRRLRDTLVPRAFASVPGRVLVTGDTAENIDYIDVNNGSRPWVFLFVFSLSFVLLTLAFRSIVVPLKAILLNLLSVGAAYGLLVLVFQKGVGADLLGLQQVDAIEVWVPLFLFSVLFGLSMDYHVFLLSRIRERFQQTGDNTAAVAFGIGSTGRIITGAALIIIVVFCGFAIGELVMFQQMGFGVAVALFLDATVVRSVLVPATMKLLGTRNWYLPRWLRWLPHLQVEPPEPARAVPGRAS